MHDNFSDWLKEPVCPIMGQCYMKPDFFDTKELHMWDGDSWVDVDVSGAGLITVLRTGSILKLIPVRISKTSWAIGTEMVRMMGAFIGMPEMRTVCIESPDIYESQEKAQHAIDTKTFTQSIVKFGI